MAYKGWLIKVGDYTISAKKWISANSYKVTRNTQDLDSYRDANGLLHREVVPYVADKVEFETPAMLTNEDIGELFKAFMNAYKSKSERKASVTLYVPELDDYVTQDMYLSNPDFSIYGNYDGKIHYNSVRIAFIGYGVKEKL